MRALEDALRGDGGRRRPLVGTVVSLPDPALAELLAGALDFVWIDLEHGALGLRDVQAITIATQATGCAALVRLPRWDGDQLAAALDAGVDGVVAPQVQSAEQASALVSRLRYPPAGSRGFGPRRAGRYGRSPAFWAAAESRVTCLVQIETPDAVTASPAIAAVEGVDAVVVGCADLSLALGVPQELTSDALRSAVAHVRAAAAAAGTGFGIAAGGAPGAIAALAGDDCALVLYSADVRIYSQAVDEAVRRLSAALHPAAEAEDGRVGAGVPDA